jgi:hypothetical protein
MSTSHTGLPRPVFVARCVRDGEWWAVSINDAEGVHIRGANTQAKRLDQVEDLARELVSVLLDVDEDSFDVTLDVDLPTEVSEEVMQAKDLRTKAEAIQQEATRIAARAAADLVRRQGLTMREAARVLGLSYQRVDQLLEKESATTA